MMMVVVATAVATTAATTAATPAGIELQVVVVYAVSDRQWVVPLTVAPGTRIRDAIAQSGIANDVADLPGGATGPWDAGVFNRPVAQDDPVHDGDRIEIYRPLRIDPKEARRLRAGTGRSTSKQKPLQHESPKG